MVAPGKPSVSLARAEPHALTVQWPGPVRRATSWAVSWTPDGGSTMTLSGIPAASREHTIAGLAAGTEYTITLAGVNDDGSTTSDDLVVSTQEAEAMAIFQSDLTRIQTGIEATAGSLVAATERSPYDSAVYEPTVTRQTLEESGTVLADTTDVVTGRGSSLEVNRVLSPETLITPLRCCLADVSPVGLGGAMRRVFTPSVTAPSGLATATIEIAANDGGSANTYQGRFGSARAMSIGITGAGEAAAETKVQWMGRARKALTSPANLSNHARWIIPTKAFACYVDDTWARLGATKMATVRSFDIELESGQSAAPAVDGAEDLDLSYFRRGRIGGTLKLVVDHDEDTTGELDHWESGDLRYFRLQASIGSGASLRRLTIDVCARYVTTPDVLSVDDGVQTLALDAELRADSANNIVSIETVTAA